MDGRRIGAIAAVAGLLALWASWTWLRSQPDALADAPPGSAGAGPRAAPAAVDAGRRALALDAMRTADAGTLQLALAGKVLQEGAPAAGAEVRYGERRTVSGDDGSFELSVPCEERQGLVATRGALSSASRVFGCDDPPEHTGLLLVLRGLASIRGEVRDEGGRPLRATVQVWPPAAAKVETDEQGRFLFASVPADRYQVHAEADGFRGRTIDEVGALSGETASVLVELHAEAVISGKVVDGAGAPIGGAELTGRIAGLGSHGGGKSGPPVVADAAGLFQVQVRDGATYKVEASARGWAPSIRMVQAPASGVVFTLSRGGEVGGVVRSKAGLPLAGVELTFRHERYRTRTAESDSEGKYGAENLAAGAWRLTAEQEGFVGTAPVEVEVVEDAYTPRDLVMAPADATLAGRVLEAGTGKAIPSAEVACAGQKSRADAEGRFRIAGLEPGKHEACATAEAHLEDCRTFEAGEEEALLEPAAGRIVKGRVLEEPGVPLDGFGVDGDWVEAADGTFRVVRPPTAKKVVVHHYGRRSVSRELGPGDVDLGDVVLSAGWPVTFKVRSPEGRPVPGASVWGSGKDGWMPELIADEDAQLVGVTDAAGELRAVLDDGSHCYRATARGFASSPTEGNVHQFKGPSTVELVLRRAARITGHVTAAGGPQKGVVVGVRGVRDGTAITDERGAYRLEGIEPGQVDVFVGRLERGMEAQGKSVELAPGDDKVVDFGSRDQGSLAGTLLCPGAVEVFVVAIPGPFDFARLDGKSPPPEGFTARIVTMASGRGTFELSELPAGTVSLVVGWSKADPKRRTTRVVELRPGEIKRLDLTCEGR